MWKATLRGLMAHKLRLALTALSIVLGVGFVSGTYLLTDTMNRAFDDLFTGIEKGVAVEVSGVPQFKATGPGGEDAGAFPFAQGGRGDPAPRSGSRTR